MKINDLINEMKNLNEFYEEKLKKITEEIQNYVMSNSVEYLYECTNEINHTGLLTSFVKTAFSVHSQIHSLIVRCHDFDFDGSVQEHTELCNIIVKNIDVQTKDYYNNGNLRKVLDDLEKIRDRSGS